MTCVKITAFDAIAAESQPAMAYYSNREDLISPECIISHGLSGHEQTLRAMW